MKTQGRYLLERNPVGEVLAETVALAGEPTASLDLLSRAIGIMLFTHEPTVANQLANATMRLRDGRLNAIHNGKRH